MRLFYRNGVYYTRYLNAVFQIPSIYDRDIQDGPMGLGWGHFICTDPDRPWGVITIIKMP